MGVEVVELVWQDVSVGNEVELASAEPFLHFDVVEAETVLSGDLVALREVVYALELVKTLVEVALARAGGPEYVPLVRVCEVKVVCLEVGTDELRVSLEQLVEHFAVVYVVTALMCHCWRGVVQ